MLIVNVVSFYNTPIATTLATDKIAIFATVLPWKGCLKFYFIFKSKIVLVSAET